MTQTFPHSLAWKVYSVLVIIADLVTIVLGGLAISNLVTGAISLVLCMPLVGHSWQRPLVPRWLGKATFVFGIILVPFLLALGANLLGFVGVLVGLGVLSLFVPYFYASFLFGYRSEHLWSNLTPQPTPTGAAGLPR